MRLASAQTNAEWRRDEYQQCSASPLGAWHYAQGQDSRGPLSVEQVAALIAGNIVNAGTLVWNAQMTEWAPLGQTELRSLLGPTPVSTSRPPPAMQVKAARPSGWVPAPAASRAPSYRVDPDREPGLWKYFVRCVTTFYATFSGRARRKEYWGLRSSCFSA